ncbi:hypothetical protein H5410_045974 [Solanum commersonii]|uniref:Uncharacterized protein n=1 Tax=Solanum commersonii TaxID=4109 RepID=A0A9J5XE97_SOLCO|nr:hypothetical protein H5410_045974 [Solanum commersonii]
MYPPELPSSCQPPLECTQPQCTGCQWRKMGQPQKSLVESRGTPARQHNSIIKTVNGKDVCLCLALMSISCSMISPKLSRLFPKIDSNKPSTRAK